jgi:hypothetical protein
MCLWVAGRDVDTGSTIRAEHHAEASSGTGDASNIGSSSPRGDDRLDRRGIGHVGRHRIRTPSPRGAQLDGERSDTGKQLSGRIRRRTRPNCGQYAAG